MYTFKSAGDTAEFWFNDVDEWEIAYSIAERAEGEKICSLALTINYTREIGDDEIVIPDEGSYLLLCMNVTDMARLEAIAQEEWCYYEADVAEWAAQH